MQIQSNNDIITTYTNKQTNKKNKKKANKKNKKGNRNILHNKQTCICVVLIQDNETSLGKKKQ